MESFVDEIKDVVAKYKAIASARITALKSAIQVAWANFIKSPNVQNAANLVYDQKTKSKKKAKKSG